MITEQEISALVSYVQSSKNPAKLFEIPYLTIRNPAHASVKIKLQPYIDFPRIAEEVLSVFIRNYCKEKSEKALKDFENYIEDPILRYQRIQDVVEEIMKEKSNPETELGFLSTSLKKLGINWWLNYGEHYKTLAIIVNANEYYQIYWPLKLKNFIRKLNEGYDYPTNIYEMASELSFQYLRSQMQMKITLPRIFETLRLSNLNIIFELENLQKMINRLRKSISVPTDYLHQIEFKNIVDSVFADMLSVVDQLYLLLETGHFASGYPLLRKLLVDLGIIFTFKSLADEYPNISREPKISSEEKLRIVGLGIKYYANNFLQNWMKMTYDKGGLPLLVIIRHENIEDNLKSWKIGSFNSLKREHLERNIFRELLSKQFIVRKQKKELKEYTAVEFGDTLYIEAIDILINHSMFVFDAIKTDITLPTREGKLLQPTLYRTYEEYHKLSDAVHSPVLVDFPPYGSTLEYLGFLHHLRKVNSIFKEALKAYMRATNTSRNKGN